MPKKTAADLNPIQDLMKDGKYDEARPLLQEYLKHKPDDPLALRLYGNTYAYTGFLGKAKKIWKEAIRKFPDNIDLLYNYALAFYLQGDLETAYRYWKRALGLNKKDSEILFSLG